MKKVTFSMCFLLLSLVLIIPTFANAEKNQSSDDELEELSEKGEIVYEDDEITIRDFGNDEEISDAIFNHPDSVVSVGDDEGSDDNKISPFSSTTGPGGRSSIVDGNSGKIVYWSVKPATAWPFNFSGTVKLRYHSGFKRNAPVGGMGALGQTVSGSVTMNKNNGGVAYLTGTATALNRHKYRVLPNIHTSF